MEAEFTVPFLLHEAAVEEDEARDTLQALDGGRGELPRSVAFAQPVWAGL